VTSLTGTGLVAGTLPYMSPEQLEGREADARTDIWALGCTLFEMLAGRRAFEGDSQAGLIAAIEKDEAPRLPPPSASPALERLVRQCLQKDPARRWQSAADVALRLREIAEGEGPGVRPPAAKVARGPLVAALAAVATVALLAGLLAGRQWGRPPAAAPAVVRSQIELPASAALLHFGRFGLPTAARNELALSPDGRLLVWSGSPDARRERSALHVRSLETGEVRWLPETEGAHYPFFSPDGRWIGYYSSTAQMLRKVPTAGGLGVDLASFAGVDFPVGNMGPMGASWAEDGRIYLGSQAGTRGGIRSVPADGGKLEEVTRVDRTREAGHRLPCALPGARALLFTAMPNAFGPAARIEALSLPSAARKVVVDDAADPRYLPTGHLVFVRQGTAMAAPFDLDRLELTAPPVPVIAGVHQALKGGDAYNSGAAQLAVSASGLLVYVPGGIFADPPAEFVLAAPGGGVEPLAGFDRPLCTGQYRFSPDGRRLAFVERAESGLLWLFDVERQTQRQITRDGIAGFPVWSPDGRRMVVTWAKEGSLNLWAIPAEGEEAWERLTTGEEHDWPSSWSPDGRVLAFVRGLEILLYHFEDRRVAPFITRPRGDTRFTAYGYAEFSPDGRWMAYVSNETGRHEVYVTSFPDRRQTLAVSREGGLSPAWSRDGRQLFYRSVDRNAVMAVSVGGGERLSLGLPSAVLPTPANAIGLMPVGRLELHPDGRRFLFARERAPTVIPPVTRIELVQNWFTELERTSPSPP
jgi:serine/threonine-protein kinase